MDELPCFRVLADVLNRADVLEDDDSHLRGKWESIHSARGQTSTRFMLRECSHLHVNLLVHRLLCNTKDVEDARVYLENSSIHRMNCVIVEILPKNESDPFICRTLLFQTIAELKQDFIKIKQDLCLAPSGSCTQQATLAS